MINYYYLIIMYYRCGYKCFEMKKYLFICYLLSLFLVVGIINTQKKKGNEKKGEYEKLKKY